MPDALRSATVAVATLAILLLFAAVARPEITKQGFTERTLQTEIVIDAPAAQVWSILTTLDAYPAWNPFIRSASGEVRPGARLSVTIQPPGRDPLSFEPTLIVVRPDRELRWRGKLWLSGLFDGEHVFEIEPLAEDRVRLRHFETFDGVLVPLLGGVLADTEEGFRAMNAALKEQAER